MTDDAMTAEHKLLAELNRTFPDACFTDTEMLDKKSSDCGTGNLFCQTNKAKPLCVVRPGKDYNEQLVRLVELARDYNKKIIVRGGGSGVCGAFNVRGSEMVVDMTQLNKLVLLQEPTTEREGLVLAEAGVFGDKLDEFLKPKGFTHGHYPASLAVSTVGGWLSTKSNGHYSLYFGNIENLVVAVEGVNGRGKIVRFRGADLKNVFRMEGTTMIVTRVWLKVFTIPAHDEFLSFRFDCIGNMACFLKKMPGMRNRLNAHGVRLYTVRAYDFIDYKFGSKPDKDSGHKSWLKKRVNYFIEKQLCRMTRTVSRMADALEKYGLMPWTVVVYMASDSKKALTQAAELLKEESEIHNGTDLGPTLARNWYSHRFKLGYDKVTERFRAGITVDTFDCPAAWNELIGAYEKIKAALSRFGLASAHIGIDLDTPYLYFIFGIAGKNRQKHRAVKEAILRTCVNDGIATTHHHGIGDEDSGKAGQGKVFVPYAYGKNWHNNVTVPAKREMDPDNIFSDHLFTDLN